MQQATGLVGVMIALLSSCSTTADAGEVRIGTVDSEVETFNVVRVVEGLSKPWALDFLPNGDILITEKTGALLRYSDGEIVRIGGIPAVAVTGQGGLLDVLVSEDFPETGRIYLSYSGSYGGGYGTRIASARLSGNTLHDVRTIFEMNAPSAGGRHFGSRMVELPDGSLVFSIGDRGQRNRAQDPSDHAGSILRIDPDGTAPPDNPFVGRGDTASEIFATGSRNTQGLTLHPETGAIWAHEHGPQGGDEINVIEAGRNYGWPEITYGEEYGGGAIGPTEAPGMEQPVTYWVPSIAPSGMDFYEGSRFPNWDGNLFVGALRGRHLRRVVLDGNRVTHEEIIRISDPPQRIRDVRRGPNGYLWILIDDSNAQLYRLEPAS